jgi:RNA-splicing ligase RtcB
MILRKGAVSAKAGEKLLIPLNMRDGSLVCEGLGNSDWNYSAPHGAGRLMSRGKAFTTLSLDEFKKEMAGIYSSTVTKGTLDESPMAYKKMDDIIRHISPTAKILSIIKPLYNFKAAE